MLKLSTRQAFMLNLSTRTVFMLKLYLIRPAFMLKPYRLGRYID